MLQTNVSAIHPQPRRIGIALPHSYEEKSDTKKKLLQENFIKENIAAKMRTFEIIGEYDTQTKGRVISYIIILNK